MKFTLGYLSGFVFALTSVSALAETKTIASPDGNIIVSVSDDAGLPSYSVKYRNEDIIKKSELGLEFKNIDGFVRNLHIVKSDTNASNTTWVQPWGERKKVNDNHKELIVELAQQQK